MTGLEMLGRGLVIVGLSLASVGGLLWVLGRTGLLNNLPGTLRVQGTGFTCILPLLGSIVLSIVLTVVLNLLLRMFNR